MRVELDAHDEFAMEIDDAHVIGRERRRADGAFRIPWALLRLAVRSSQRGKKRRESIDSDSSATVARVQRSLVGSRGLHRRWHGQMNVVDRRLVDFTRLGHGARHCPCLLAFEGATERIIGLVDIDNRRVETRLSG